MKLEIEIEQGLIRSSDQKNGRDWHRPAISEGRDEDLRET
jgi:hypothetical protein